MRRPTLEPLATEDVRRIVEAAHDLLENFGVVVDNQKALQILADGGARVDLDEKGHLSSRHTRQWFRNELFFPTDVINRKALRAGHKSSTAWERAQTEVQARMSKYEPPRLPGEKTQEIKAVFQSYARSKGVDKLPEVPGGWEG